VDTLAAQQVDAIKIWVDDLGHKAPKIKPSVIDAIIDQARRYNIPVTAHIYSLADTEHLVQAGAAGFLHMIQDTENIDPAFIARLRDLRIVFAPTLVRQELDWRDAEPPKMLDEADVARTVDEGSIDSARQAARWRCVDANRDVRDPEPPHGGTRREPAARVVVIGCRVGRRVDARLPWADDSSRDRVAGRSRAFTHGTLSWPRRVAPWHCARVTNWEPSSLAGWRI
jgi:hypothetical protein